MDKDKSMQAFFKVKLLYKFKQIPKELNENCIEIYIGTEAGKTVIRIILTKSEWQNLLNFFKKIKDNKALPTEFDLFTGFNINENMILHKDATHISNYLIDKIHNLKERIPKLAISPKSKKETIDDLEKKLEGFKNLKKESAEGEILSNQIHIIFDRTHIFLGREDFIKFREICINFDDNIK